MKKIYLTLTILLSTLIFSPFSYADWRKVTTHKNGNIDYIDPEKIKIYGSSRFYWVLEDYIIPNDSGVMSMMIYTQAECDLWQTRNLKYATFELSMGEGAVKSIWSANDKKWRYVKSRSVSESNVKFVCSYQK
jgi:hypothetical protein